MRWKESLTPLDQVPNLGGEARDRLLHHHITTAEELVGQIEAEPRAVGELLGLEDEHLAQLCRRAAEVMNPEVALAMQADRGHDRGLGALPPNHGST